MTNETQTIADVPVIQQLKLPSTLDPGIHPNAVLTVKGQSATDLVQAADNLTLSIQVALDFGWVYRLVYADMILLSLSAADAWEWEPAGELTTVFNGDTQRSVTLGSELYNAVDAVSFSRYYENLASATNGHATQYRTRQNISQPFKVIDSAGQVQFRLVNGSAAATAAGSVIWNAQLLRYTIEQYDDTRIWTPIPII